MAESRGYIKLDRNIRDNANWPSGKFSRFEAWVDLLLRAAWKAHKVDFGGELVALKPGELVTSYRVLGRAWGWSPNRVRRLVNRLIENGTLTAHQTAHRNTLISVSNYAKYQHAEKGRHTSRHENGTRTAHQRHTDGTRENKGKARKQGKALLPELDPAAGFDTFWAAWPKKVNKPDARKAWAQVAADRPPVAELVAAINHALGSHEWRDKQYMPYPATWLRGHGWQDELTTRGGNGKAYRRPGDEAPTPAPPPVPRVECDPEAEALWRTAQEALAGELDPHSYNTWIRPTSGMSLDDGELVVAVPNPVFRDWLADHYAAQVAEAVGAEVTGVRFHSLGAA